MVEPDTQTATVSTNVRIGRVVTALVALYLLFDSSIRLLKMTAAVEGAQRLGYPESLIVGIGIMELVCVVLYLIPRTAVLGAILLTGHLGGAAAAIARLENPWFLFPIGLGVMVWGGLFLRDSRLRALIPLRA
ncbi:DoxX-like family protein [Mesorhizobium albiziae]|uniref:DoxX-like family protein n=1 Tax=Neomesorhizobium albiziae TaxID=335020 RepID=A0A1I4BFS0_9HYPH|nr:DoxX family protein [Mesorhizobium albiziae]GLS29827.1 membrane protein [Mesorhizobium albiziae]SFK67140.1 DoxX-like family protein [Mesorhizobium albiziae]